MASAAAVQAFQDLKLFDGTPREASGRIFDLCTRLKLTVRRGAFASGGQVCAIGSIASILHAAKMAEDKEYAIEEINDGLLTQKISSYGARILEQHYEKGQLLAPNTVDMYEVILDYCVDQPITFAQLQALEGGFEGYGIDHVDNYDELPTSAYPLLGRFLAIGQILNELAEEQAEREEQEYWDRVQSVS